MSNKNSYNIAAKSTFLFGSVQAFRILSTIAKGKILAVYLGPFGLGIASIFMNTLASLQTISNFGLNFSGVREIAFEKKKNDSKLGKLIFSLLIYFLFFSIFLSIFILIFSSKISLYSFGSVDYSLHYKFLAIVILLNAVNWWYQTIFQGIRELNIIAKSSVVSSILSVVFTFPVYHFYGIDGIVPSIIITSALTLLISFFYSKKINLKLVRIKIIDLIINSKHIVSLGFTKMTTSLMGNLSTLIIILVIQKLGSLEEVGLYEVGMKISYQYVGLIFAAITVDYFPRISAVSNNTIKVNEVSNHQTEITLLLVIPILMSLMIFTPLIIQIMFSSDFLEITDFIRFCSIGVFFLTAKQALDLIPFAKGDKSIFFYYTLYGSLSLIFFSYLGYIFEGLYGVGLFFILHCFLALLIIVTILIKKYQYVFTSNSLKYFGIGFIQIILTALLVFNFNTSTVYLVGIFLLFLSFLFSIKELDKLIDLRNLFKNFNRIN